MKTNDALQVIFAFFLGLVVVAFVGIGVNTFYPEPQWVDGMPSGYDDWRLLTGIILLVCATAILVISLLLPEEHGVLSNGLLLGGVFTMVYAVGMTVSAANNLWRFIVVAAALAITIAIGYAKFVRGRSRLVPIGKPVGEPVPVAVEGELTERLAAVERKLDALGRALQG